MNTAGAKKRESGVLWWLGWILSTLATFFVSCAFWTRFIADRVGNMNEPGVPILWVVSVFGTWMLFLVPLIILMYHKVDKAYEDARLAREETASKNASSLWNIRSIFVDESRRLLNKPLSQKLKTIPPALRRGHLVTAILKDGRRIEHVFIWNRKSLLGVYGTDRLDFNAGDIMDVEPTDWEHIPAFEAERWLRLDGANPSKV